MNYWITTDTHLGHKKMEKYCGRPPDFEEKIFEQIKSKVKCDDVLLNLGDVCIGRDKYWHTKYLSLGTHKNWLIKGNHDRKSNSWYNEVGWDFVANKVVLKAFGKNIIFSHEPVEFTGDFINIHGHAHNTTNPETRSYYNDGRHKLLYIEHEYAPVKLEALLGKEWI